MAEGHGHGHGPASYGRAFAIGIGLNLGFVIIEATIGILAGSLALVADAGHNLSDVLGLVLAWGASVLVGRRPTPRRSYGLRRASILAALANAVTLLFALGVIAWEAIGRFRHPAPVEGGLVIAVALVGIAINAGTALLFLRGRHDDLNIRGAFLHMAADAGVSLGVVIAGLIIVATGWLWVDPVVSLAIAALIFVGTWGLLRESMDLALDAAPQGTDVAAVRDYLAGLPGVANLHDLHIWAMSTTETALTVHLVLPGVEDTDALLGEIARGLHDRFGIEHVTVQVERQIAANGCVSAVGVPGV